MATELRWDDAEEIGIALAEKFPNLNPLTRRDDELRRYVSELPTFVDDPGASDDRRLQAIQNVWQQERDSRQ